MIVLWCFLIHFEAWKPPLMLNEWKRVTGTVFMIWTFHVPQKKETRTRNNKSFQRAQRFTSTAAYGSWLFYKWKAQHFHEACIRLSKAQCNTFWEFADDFECFCVKWSNYIQDIFAFINSCPVRCKQTQKTLQCSLTLYVFFFLFQQLLLTNLSMCIACFLCFLCISQKGSTNAAETQLICDCGDALPHTPAGGNRETPEKQL